MALKVSVHDCLYTDCLFKAVLRAHKWVLDADTVQYIYRFLPVHVSVLMQLSDTNRVFTVVAYEVTAIHTKLQALINPFNSSYINKCVNFWDFEPSVHFQNHFKC